MTLFTQDNDQITIDETKNYLEELVGDGKKFKSPEELARGKYEADMFIAAKNRQYDDLYKDYTDLREKATAGASLQEVLDQIQKLQSTSNDNTNVNVDTSPAIKPEELKTTLSSMLQEMKQADKEDGNYQTVQNKLKERFGANAGTFLKQKADSLGLSENDAIAMARRNPALFYKTFDVEINANSEQFQTPPQSQQRSEAFAPKTNKHTRSWYNKLRQENPTEYYKPQTSIQMDKDSQALGQSFWDV